MIFTLNNGFVDLDMVDGAEQHGSKIILHTRSSPFILNYANEQDATTDLGRIKDIVSARTSSLTRTALPPQQEEKPQNTPKRASWLRRIFRSCRFTFSGE